ncbi:hypothetical protein WJX84_004876 [Apatococcus fuscideae]|uniref:Uncharacterized protein n=1 Tax=Apatococcus fuscideae TaxID=2026836 RepID=A0AAW1SY02_9CHLO
MIGPKRPGCDAEVTPPLNIAHRLRSRELCAWPSAAQAGRARQFCQSLLPSVAISNVELPDCFINRFTNSGEYLVCFGNMQHDLVLFRCLGPGEDVQHQESSSAAPPSFNGFFSMLYQKTLAHGTELLCRDFSLTAHQEKYLLLASSCLPGIADHVEDPGVTRIQGLVNVPGTTFLLLELASGQVRDTYSIPNDFIHLANNSGANLYDDLLAICAVNSQTIHLVHVHPAGQLIPLHSIGQHCFPDDDLILSRQTEREAAWRQQHQAEARQIDRQFTTAQGPASTMLPVFQEAATGSGQADHYPTSQPGQHQEGSTGGFNQDQAFLASHFPPALQGSLPANQLGAGGLAGTHSLPQGAQSPQQHMTANLAQAAHPESPAQGDVQASQTPAGDGDLEAAIDDLDADAGMQGQDALAGRVPGGCWVSLTDPRS